MPTIKLFPGEKQIEVVEGAGLMAVSEQHDLPLAFGCGSGACGSCRVLVRKNANHLSLPTQEEEEFLKTLGAKAQERLACCCRVLGDIEIEPV